MRGVQGESNNYLMGAMHFKVIDFETFLVTFLDEGKN
jgi:hypothetical protein